jgi:hypothetical protein
MVSLESSTPFGHQVQIRLIVFIAEESIHPPITALGNVVRNSGSC